MKFFESCDYEEFYKKITAGLRKHPRLCSFVPALDKVLVIYMYIAFALLIAFTYLKAIPVMGTRAFLSHDFLVCLLVPAAGFLFETVVRAKINRKRPYEKYDISPLIKKYKTGESMPSRHVFSAAVISTAVLFLSRPFGIVCFIISILSAVVRVIGGVHYPSDVIVGFLLGITIGSLCFFL